MENEFLEHLWNNQNKNNNFFKAEEIIKQAKNQRKNQFFSTVIMSITVVILVAYSIYILPQQWNNFTLGLVLMISSLVFRIILEIISVYKRKNKLISMDNRSFHSYLKYYYKIRLLINYSITPICIAVYIYGFYLLLPYFKAEFSQGFYTYILISGVVSLLVVTGIIISSILKEQRFLESLKSKA